MDLSLIVIMFCVTIAYTITGIKSEQQRNIDSFNNHFDDEEESQSLDLTKL